MVDGDQYLSYHGPSLGQGMWSTSPTTASSQPSFTATTTAYPQQPEHSYAAARTQGAPGYSAVRDGYAAPAPPAPAGSAQELGSQVDSNVGPSRSARGVTTRRQARAQAAQQQPRSVSAPQPSVSQVLAADGTYYPTGSMSPPAVSRPQTPNGSARDSPFRHPYPPPPPDGHVSPNGLTGPVAHSPAYPSTPLSTSTTYSPYSYFPNHSRSTSGATSGPRSASPASSIRSAITSLSSTSAPPYGDRLSPALQRFGADKQKKTRLTNADRRRICVYSGDHPTARQEDIAAMWNVERSTISKILKAKAKWLATPIEDDAKTARHRPSKFPEIEREMEAWLHDVHKNGRTRPSVTLSDHNIRTRAKEIARNLQISEEKFKASSGWVENFKHRHNIKRGVWNGPLGDEEPDGAAGPSFVLDGGDAMMQNGDGHPHVDANGPADYTRNLYPPPLPHEWDMGSQEPAPSTPSSLPPRPPSAPAYAPPPPRSPPLPFPLVAHVHPPTALQSMSAAHDTSPSGAISAPPSLLMNGNGMAHPLAQRHSPDDSDFGLPATADDLPPPPAPPNAYGPEPLPYPRARPAAGLAPAPIIVAMHEDSPMAGPTSASAYAPQQSFHYPPALPPAQPSTQLPPVLPPPMPPPAPAHADGAAAPSSAAAERGELGTPVVGVKGAEVHMDALLDFFDAQPEGAIITPEDREKLAQIRCKLLATANGVSYRRGDRVRRPT